MVTKHSNVHVYLSDTVYSLGYFFYIFIQTSLLLMLTYVQRSWSLCSNYSFVLRRNTFIFSVCLVSSLLYCTLKSNKKNEPRIPILLTVSLKITLLNIYHFVVISKLDDSCAAFGFYCVLQSFKHIPLKF